MDISHFLHNFVGRQPTTSHTLPMTVDSSRNLEQKKWLSHVTESSEAYKEMGWCDTKTIGVQYWRSNTCETVAQQLKANRKFRNCFKIWKIREETCYNGCLPSIQKSLKKDVEYVLADQPARQRGFRPYTQYLIKRNWMPEFEATWENDEN